MKRIMTGLGAAGLLAAMALTASANSDVAEIAQEFARATRPAWNEIVRERRSYRPERFGNDDVELPTARIFEQALISRSKSARTADGPIGIGVEVCPALTLDPCAAQPKLILDRCVSLKFA